MIKLLMNRVFVVGVLSALTATLLVHYHWSSVHKDLKLSIANKTKENLQQVIKLNQLRDTVTEINAEKLALRQRVEETKARKITKEVIKYVKTNDNSQCPVDPEWVRIADNATPVSGATQATSGTDETTDEVRDLGEALDIVTRNYQACQDAVTRLEGWQSWYREIQSVNND